MSDPHNNDLIKRGLAELKALEAEVAQAVKTASEEAREGWKKLQPHIERAEKLAAEKASGVAQEVGESAGEMIEEVRGKLEELRKRIRKA
jgi:ElaB/YqjD/DUF883 family membrane-anchored ribosome-binding protein